MSRPSIGIHVAERRRTKLRRPLRWIVTLMMIGLWSHTGIAQFELHRPLTRDRIQLPLAAAGSTAGNAGFARGSGFTASIDVTTQFSVGYVGVDATLTSTLGPLAATRELGIRFTPINRQVPAEPVVAVEIPVTFPQGQSTVSLNRSFPKWTVGNAYRVEIIEEGAPIDSYSTEIGTAFPGYMLQSPALAIPHELTTNILLVDTELDTMVLRDGGMLSIPSQQVFIQSSSLGTLPADWRLLGDIDCIVIEYDRLIAASEVTGNQTTSADVQKGIRDWLLMGGLLVVLNAPATESLARDLNVTPQLSKNDASGFRYTVDAVTAGSNSLAESYREWIQSMTGNASGQGPGASGQGPGSTLQPFGGRIIDTAVPQGMLIDSTVRPSPKQLSDTQQWIDDFEAILKRSKANWDGSSFFRAGFGSVIGLNGDRIDDVNSCSILHRWSGLRRSPMLERGVDPMLGDFRSRRWLIPGVAQPPVYTFMGILTLFVLLVGPVAYRWTSRGHRSHLMFLIAPVLAIVTTAAMFAYSILADGFGTSVRVRQLTWIDGASGDAIERTRSTLFAGISPRSGLRFPTDAELMVYPDGGRVAWEEQSGGAGEVRSRVVIRDDAQELDPSFLPSRTQTQFVTHNIRRGQGGVSLGELKPFDAAESAVNATTVQISNSLPFEIRDLVVRSPDGRYWTTPRIGSGETANATWITKSQDASKQIGELYIRHRPIGAVSESSGVQRQTVRDLMIYLNRENNAGGTAMTDGIMEFWLNEQLFVKGDLPAGMFLGISDPSDDSVAVSTADLTASVRYVMGTLQ